jgi:hypothetical protein
MIVHIQDGLKPVIQVMCPICKEVKIYNNGEWLLGCDHLIVAGDGGATKVYIKKEDDEK